MIKEYIKTIEIKQRQYNVSIKQGLSCIIVDMKAISIPVTIGFDNNIYGFVLDTYGFYGFEVRVKC